MIRSMTGYGSSHGATEGTTVRAEARAVNGRHLKVRTSLPPGGEAWDPLVRDVVSEHVSRGTLDVRIQVDRGEDADRALELDTGRIEAYLDAFERLRTEYSLPGQVDLPLLVRAGGLLRETESDPTGIVTEEFLRDLLGDALDQLVGMREEEGRRLQEELRGHLDAIQGGLERVEQGAPERLERERERLRRSAGEMLEDRPVDESRLAQEIAYLADKWDVGEEIARARSHVEAFRDLLDAPADEPVGRRLSFLVQELHRELNTTGAKANDADISHVVVEMKNELEGIREQVENVE